MFDLPCGVARGFHAEVARLKETLEHLVELHQQEVEEARRENAHLPPPPHPTLPLPLRMLTNSMDLLTTPSISRRSELTPSISRRSDEHTTNNDAFARPVGESIPTDFELNLEKAVVEIIEQSDESKDEVEKHKQIFGEKSKAVVTDGSTSKNKGDVEENGGECSTVVHAGSVPEDFKALTSLANSPSVQIHSHSSVQILVDIDSGRKDSKESPQGKNMVPSLPANRSKEFTRTMTKAISAGAWNDKKVSHYHVRKPWSDKNLCDKHISLLDIVRKERKVEEHDFIAAPSLSQKRVSAAITRVKSDKSRRKSMVSPSRYSSCILPPMTKFRAVWVLVSISLLLYDLAIVPVDICFEPEQTDFTRGMDIFANSFWSIDIFLTFITAVTLDDGTVEIRLGRIARIYARTWLIFDLLLVLPDWATFALGVHDFEGDKVSVLRVIRWGRLMRIWRLARVVRLAKLKPLLRHLVYEFNLSKPYVMVTRGWLGFSAIVVVVMHIVSCFWYALGSALNEGWVHDSFDDGVKLAHAYVYSLHWAFNRLQGIRVDVQLTTTLELLLDSFLAYGSLILASYYLGQVAALAVVRSNSQTVNLWKTSISFTRRHKICAETSLHLAKVLEASHSTGAGAIAAEEAMLLKALPATLQQDLLFEARSRFLIEKIFFFDVFSFNQRAVRHICNGAMTSNVVVAAEVVFALGDSGHGMYFIDTGKFRYLSQSTDGSIFKGANTLFNLDEDNNSKPLAEKTFISEPVLWTIWEHMGSLQAMQEATMLFLREANFSKIVMEYKGPLVHGFRYAKHFVWNLNRCETPNDLTEFDDLTLDNLDEELFSGTDEDHFMFISHYKVEAGTEATLMRDLMGPILESDVTHPANTLKSPIFIDSEDLVDLAGLKDHVIGSVAFILLLTPGVLSRPWCLVEIVTAIRCDAVIVPVEVQRPGSKYQYPNEEFYADLLAGKLVNSDGVDLLANEGMTLADVENAIRQVFQKIALPFSPHKSKMVRDAELQDILKRCSQVNDPGPSAANDGLQRDEGVPYSVAFSALSEG